VLALNDYDIVFYDTPPAIDQHPEVLKTLAYAADLILVPSAVGIADTESAEILLKLLQEWNRPTIAVLNKVKRNALKTIGIAKRRLLRMADLAPVEIGEYYDFLVADEVGLGATEMDTCVGKDDIEALWTIVERRLGLKG
jgi:chromosome partitioning protein